MVNPAWVSQWSWEIQGQQNTDTPEWTPLTTDTLEEKERQAYVAKRTALSEKINAIWSGKISWVKPGSEKSLKELAIGDRGDLKNLENGLGELKTLISANQEFIMSDEGLRLELTNSLNDVKAGLESKNRGWLNGTKIKERLLKEVDGLISIFSSPEKIPDYNKAQDIWAAKIWSGPAIQNIERQSSASSSQKVEEVNIIPNVDPIPNHSDLLPGSSAWTTGSPDKKDQVNGGRTSQSETPIPQGKNQRELERQKQLAAEKAKKEAEKKAKELAEQEKKAAEKRKQEEEKKKRLQEENEKKEAEKKEKKPDKPSERKETTTSREFTRDSKFEDLATLSGDTSNLKFEFNKGVLQTDGNGKYILINGEKYYEYSDDENKQNPALKYFDLNRNHPKGIEIQFWGLDSGYVQPDFSFVPEK